MSTYRRPGWWTRQVLNRLVAALTGHGVSVLGSRLLTVRGRTSGRPRTTPVNVLTLAGGERYLVAPRGETDWVRNLRAAAGATLRHGARTEHVVAEEVADAAKPEILRAYLQRWRWEVGTFFDGVGPAAPDAELRRISGRHPVFRIAARPVTDATGPLPGSGRGAPPVAAPR